MLAQISARLDVSSEGFASVGMDTDQYQEYSVEYRTQWGEVRIK